MLLNFKIALKYFLIRKKLRFFYFCKKITKLKLKEELKKIENNKKEDEYAINKLGVAYNLFDGEELLESSILSIRNVVSYIVVVYQKISNYGESCNERLEEHLLELKKKKLIDELYLYESDLDKGPKYNETTKRNIGLKLVKKNGCNYFLSMDVDEFYHSNQLKNAFKFIVMNKIKSSAVSFYTYIKELIYQVVNGHINSKFQDFTAYVPFITKICSNTKHSITDYYPCLVDSTRQINGKKKFYLFPKHIVAMYHMNSIRINLYKKYNNSSEANSENVEKIKKSLFQWNYNENIINVSKFDCGGYTMLKKFQMYLMLMLKRSSNVY